MEFLDVVRAGTYGIIGLFGAISFGCFTGGFILYLSRLGRENRKKGIVVMEWGVAILFVVVCIEILLRVFE